MTSGLRPTSCSVTFQRTAPTRLGEASATLVRSRAPVAQGIERAPPEREVAGSIPAGRTDSRRCGWSRCCCRCWRATLGRVRPRDLERRGSLPRTARLRPLPQPPRRGNVSLVELPARAFPRLQEWISAGEDGQTVVAERHRPVLVTRSSVCERMDRVDVTARCAATRKPIAASPEPELRLQAVVTHQGPRSQTSLFEDVDVLHRGHRRGRTRWRSQSCGVRDHRKPP